MKSIYVTHCSRDKDPRIEKSGEKVSPERLYTSEGLQRFIRFCKMNRYDWAVFSDHYGVVFPEEKINWYSKPPDTVTEVEFSELLRSFTTRLAEFDEIWFQHRPGENHPVFKRIIEKALEQGMKVHEFTVEDMNTNR